MGVDIYKEKNTIKLSVKQSFFIHTVERKY